MTTLKVVTCNVNGLRAAARKGFFDWLQDQDADVVCLQEVKAAEDKIAELKDHLTDYHAFWACAQKPGYSGVGILSRTEPSSVSTELAHALADEEGRYIRADYDDYSVVSLYMPSGTSGDERQALKMAMLTHWKEEILPSMQAEDHPIILTGDINIAHREIDLRNWKSNQKNSGFLPEERAWMDDILGDYWHDALRVSRGDEPDLYTWWTYRANAYNNNVGWRIDYQLVSEQWLPAIREVSIARETRFSDHAPMTVVYDLDKL